MALSASAHVCGAPTGPPVPGLLLSQVCSLTQSWRRLQQPRKEVLEEGAPASAPLGRPWSLF